MVLEKDGTSVYHRPACLVVRNGQGVLAMTRVQAEARGLKAHDACDPSRMPPEPAALPGQGGTSARPAAPTYVSVDTSGKHYHRIGGCTKPGRDQTKVLLNDAAKKWWPCPICRPPIRKRKG